MKKYIFILLAIAGVSIGMYYFFNVKNNTTKNIQDVEISKNVASIENETHTNQTTNNQIQNSNLQNANTKQNSQSVSSSGTSQTTIENKNTTDTNTSNSNQTQTQSQVEKTIRIDVHKLPLGDGKISTSAKVGYLYPCNTSFRGGGAMHAGDWISGTTWDLAKKLSVLGEKYWPNASFATHVDINSRYVIGNDLPLVHATGNFPVSVDDPAYQIDRNPNAIMAQNLNYTLPANPQVSGNAYCLPMGPIGVTLSGVVIYNALDDAGHDAVANEVQDKCAGHPQSKGQYHYHGPSSCLADVDKNNTLVGYALDGFGIYSRFDVNGKEYTNADLDECHGVTSEIVWDGKKVNMYHYVMTNEYPYTLGCFRAKPVTTLPPR